MSDENLINNILSGKPGSFKQLVDENQSIVVNTCFRFVNNREDAEDLAQEVFIQVYNSLSSFRGNSKLSTWIYRIAVTKSLDFIKRKKSKKRFGLIKSIFGENDDMENQLKASQNSNPNKEVENNERIKLLSWALDSLAENQRVAFTLSKYDQLSYKEIAAILETSVPSVESLIFRAKKNLKKKLLKHYEKIF